MTPGINVAKSAGITFQVHEYSHGDGDQSYGAEAADKLGVPEARVFKTLVVSLENAQLAVAVVPVSSMLSMKLLARSSGAKKAVMAGKSDGVRATGYVLGGVSPLGQKKRLATFIDSSAEYFPSIYVSAGRRGLEIELAPGDLVRLTGGSYAAICQ